MNEAIAAIGLAQDFAGFVAAYLRPTLLLVGLPLFALGAWHSYRLLTARKAPRTATLHRGKRQ